MSQNISLDYIHPYCDVVRWQIQCLQGKVTNTNIGLYERFLEQRHWDIGTVSWLTWRLSLEILWTKGRFRAWARSCGRLHHTTWNIMEIIVLVISAFFPLLFWSSVNCKELKQWKMKLSLLGNIVFLIIHKSTLILRFKLTLVDINQSVELNGF